MASIAALPPPSFNDRAEVCFVACHPAAASHFADFYIRLGQLGRFSCRMIATEKAAEEIQKQHIPVYNFYEGARPLKELSGQEQDKLAISVAKICRHARLVMLDVGTEFSAKVAEKFTDLYPSIVRAAEYDNLEDFVPGGYSATAAKVIAATQVVFFANAKLANAPLYATADRLVPIDFQGKERVPLGYANLRDVDELLDKRKPEVRLPSKVGILQGEGLDPKTIQTFAVYFGGANEVYYEQAFPHFLGLLTEASKTRDLSDVAIMIQQHPRSVLEGNRDGVLLRDWQKNASERAPKVFVSSCSFNKAVAATDLALYYQTGAATRFMLAGVHTAQVGHEPYPDILVRNGFCPFITQDKQFLQLLEELPALPAPGEKTRNEIMEESGINPAWSLQLASLLERLVQ